MAGRVGGEPALDHELARPVLQRRHLVVVEQR
jgi:hypothetical protein